MSIRVKGLLEIHRVLDPSSLQHTEHRLEVWSVVADARILLGKGPEVLAHLVDLVADRSGVQDAGGDIWLLNGVQLVVVGAAASLARLGETVIVMTRVEVNTVQHSAKLAHTNSMDVVTGTVRNKRSNSSQMIRAVRVVVDCQYSASGVQWLMVGLGSRTVRTDIRNTTVTFKANTLFEGGLVLVGEIEIFVVRTEQKCRNREIGSVFTRNVWWGGWTCSGVSGAP